MTEMEPHDEEMDRLLLRSMRASVPVLPTNFDRRVLRAAMQNSDLKERYRWILFAVYAITSALTSLLIMHNAGLGWLATVCIVLPLTLVSVAVPVWKVKRARVQASAA